MKTKNKISVIIPTLNRSEDLRITLNSILNQTLKPDEIIIVDQSEDHETKKVCDEFKKKLRIVYLRQKEKSSVKARNKGMKKSKGDILVFLDDDVRVDKDYFNEMMESYKDERVIAVTGWMIDEKHSRNGIVRKLSGILNITYLILGLMFQVAYYKYGTAERLRDKVRIRSKTKPRKDIKMCTFRGGNMSFRKRSATFKDTRLDEKMTKYCQGEDFDFSYRIYRAKAKEESMILNPRMIVKHSLSEKGKITKKEYFEMHFSYLGYLEVKNFSYTKTQIIISITGYGLILILASLVKLKINDITKIIKAFIKTLKRIEDIKEMNLDKINKEIFR